MKGSTTPYGTIDSPMNTLTMMLTYGATFVAQAFAGNPKVTDDIIKQAIEHKVSIVLNVGHGERILTKEKPLCSMACLIISPVTFGFPANAWGTNVAP